MFYLVFSFLIAAMASAAAAFVMLALLARRGKSEYLGILLRLELFIALVLVINFIAFVIESTTENPDTRILFLLMSVANIGIGGMAWQAARFCFTLAGARRGPYFDSAFLAGIVLVYIVSVYFSLSWGAAGGIAYDNSVGYRIPSIASALVSIYCVIMVLARLKRVEAKWRTAVKFGGAFLLAMDILSILNETLPLARWLGLAQLPLSPFLLIALNVAVILLAWRRLDAPDENLFDEKTISLAVERLSGAFDLSAREREIAALLLSGALNSAIAEQLFISVFTVKNHVHSIFRKTGAENRLDLIRIANSLKKD